LDLTTSKVPSASVAAHRMSRCSSLRRPASFSTCRILSTCARGGKSHRVAHGERLHLWVFRCLPMHGGAAALLHSAVRSFTRASCVRPASKLLDLTPYRTHTTTVISDRSACTPHVCLLGNAAKPATWHTEADPGATWGHCPSYTVASPSRPHTLCLRSGSFLHPPALRTASGVGWPSASCAERRCCPSRPRSPARAHAVAQWVCTQSDDGDDDDD